MLVLAYFAVALVTWVVLARLVTVEGSWIYDEYGEDVGGDPDTVGRLIWVTIAMIVSTIWPLVVLGALVWRIAFRKRESK